MHIESEQGSERATNDGGKIITLDGRTHVTWQDVSQDGHERSPKAACRRTELHGARLDRGDLVPIHERGQEGNPESRAFAGRNRPAPASGSPRCSSTATRSAGPSRTWPNRREPGAERSCSARRL